MRRPRNGTSERHAICLIPAFRWIAQAMFDSQDFSQGLGAFAAFLEEEYGQPFSVWREAASFGDRENLQISRALGLLIKMPIAEALARSKDEIAASETGGRRNWSLSDAKIADSAWEGSWQWQLLAEIDNASKSAAGGMMTPSDPRLFLLSTRYSQDSFALLAGHLQDLLCDRPALAMGKDATSLSEILRQVPGFAAASPALVAGTIFLISKLGPESFCDWCSERREARDDDTL
jgi:hypothetical protein